MIEIFLLIELLSIPVQATANQAFIICLTQKFNLKLFFMLLFKLTCHLDSKTWHSVLFWDTGKKYFDDYDCMINFPNGGKSTGLRTEILILLNI